MCGREGCLVSDDPGALCLLFGPAGGNSSAPSQLHVNSTVNCLWLQCEGKIEERDQKYAALLKSKTQAVFQSQRFVDTVF